VRAGALRGPSDRTSAAQAVKDLGGVRGLARAAASKPISLIIAVRPELWAELLARLISNENDIQVVARATSEDDLSALAAVRLETVVLFDYEAMGPGVEGVIARMRRLAPNLRFLVLARRFTDETSRAVLKAGAAGVVGKHMDYATLLAAIRSIAVGEVWANRQITAQVISQLIASTRSEPQDTPALTRREWEVVDAVGRGQRNQEIALGLGISEKTVKTHLNNIFVKTGMKGRFALALWAQGAVGPKT